MFILRQTSFQFCTPHLKTSQPVLPYYLRSTLPFIQCEFDKEISIHFQPNPTYNYEYQVADEESQTYITHQEGREDNVVNGQYSYVDPFGALITVTYIADSNGYREERNSEANFVQVRAQPVRAIQEPAPVSQVVLPTPVRRAPVPKPAPKPAPKPVVRKVVKAKPAADDSDLVARIIAQLTPFIRNTVSTSLGSTA